MPDTQHFPWNAVRRLFLERIDHWFSHQVPDNTREHEPEWLGWDGWVRTDRPN